MNVDTLNYRGSGPDGPEGEGGLRYVKWALLMILMIR